MADAVFVTMPMLEPVPVLVTLFRCWTRPRTGDAVQVLAPAVQVQAAVVLVLVRVPLRVARVPVVLHHHAADARPVRQDVVRLRAQPHVAGQMDVARDLPDDVVRTHQPPRTEVPATKPLRNGTLVVEAHVGAAHPHRSAQLSAHLDFGKLLAQVDRIAVDALADDFVSGFRTQRRSVIADVVAEEDAAVEQDARRIGAVVANAGEVGERAGLDLQEVDHPGCVRGDGTFDEQPLCPERAVDVLAESGVVLHEVLQHELNASGGARLASGRAEVHAHAGRGCGPVAGRVDAERRPLRRAGRVPVRGREHRISFHVDRHVVRVRRDVELRVCVDSGGSDSRLVRAHETDVRMPLQREVGQDRPRVHRRGVDVRHARPDGRRRDDQRFVRDNRAVTCNRPGRRNESNHGSFHLCAPLHFQVM